ncbi:hypothetical protein PGQ11_002488 [Apiospora arundinis]|uniref:Uncharacterized protein n=1 Tax=Apiospora arundinis TaxID=335852 RepID=A0ABR2JIA9_9PEZI
MKMARPMAIEIGTNFIVPRPGLLGSSRRPDITPAEVGKGDRHIRVRRQDLLRGAVRRAARPRRPRVQPVHVRLLVVPEAEDEHHAAVERRARRLEAAVAVKVLLVLLVALGAERGRHGRLGFGNRLAVLDVDAADLAQHFAAAPSRAVGLLGGHELRHHGEGPLGVDGLVGAVEVGADGLVRVEAAAGLAAQALFAVAALDAGAEKGAGLGAGVGGHGRGEAIGLPDVHLVAAGAAVVEIGLLVKLCQPRKSVIKDPNAKGERESKRKGCPSDFAYLAIDHGFIVALCIAVAGAVLSSSRVELAPVTAHIHLVQIEGSVQTAAQQRHVDIEGKLLIQEADRLVVHLVLGEQIDTRRCPVVAARLVGHEQPQVERRAIGGHTHALVVGALKLASLGTCRRIGTDALVHEPFLLTSGVGVAALAHVSDHVEGVHQSIQHDARSLRHAAPCLRAFLCW